MKRKYALVIKEDYTHGWKFGTLCYFLRDCEAQYKRYSWFGVFSVVKPSRKLPTQYLKEEHFVWLTNIKPETIETIKLLYTL